MRIALEVIVFFNDTATTEIYTLSLHDALPIYTVVEEALVNKCNLIISHHPFFFSSLKKIDIANDRNSRLIQKIIKHDIILYSVHTNLDYSKDGVSFQLAKRLEL